jgi:hypothetical protein
MILSLIQGDLEPVEQDAWGHGGGGRFGCASVVCVGPLLLV